MYMLTSEVLNYILGITSLGAVAFGIYSSVRKPQEDTEKAALILAEQRKWDKEDNERRFKEIGDNLTRSNTIAENHIHTVDVKVTALDNKVVTMDKNIGIHLAQLTTVIKERFPRKENNDGMPQV